MQKLFLFSFIFFIFLLQPHRSYSSDNETYDLKTNLLAYNEDQILDPTKLKFVQEYFILDNVTAKLVGLGKNNQYENDLAESLEFSKDKKTINIKLKKAFYSDGTPITADDVAKSLKRSVVLGTPHANFKNLWVGSEKLKTINDNIEGIKVNSTDSLTLKLNFVTKEILYFLTMIDLAVLHKSQYEKDTLLVKDWMNITAGAYHISLAQDRKLVLKANPKTLNFSDKMPKSVLFNSYKGDNVIERLKNLSLDFGMINFNDFSQNQEFIESIRNLQIVGDKIDSVVHLDLNPKSRIFSKLQNRQWVQKKIIENFQVDRKYSKSTSKAFQFFLPNAKGYISTDKIKNLLSHVNTKIIPKDLKNGFKIKTISGMKYYMPPNMAEKLSEVLGIKVDLDMSTPGKDYTNFIRKRDFDATIISTGMNNKIIGEALNIQYLSEAPGLIDPSGKVKPLLYKYQKIENDSKEVEIISTIVKQIVIDGECVPLFYSATPFFINTNKIDMSNINLDESIKFYKGIMK